MHLNRSTAIAVAVLVSLTTALTTGTAQAEPTASSTIDTGQPSTVQSMPQALSISDSGGSARFDTSLSFLAGGGLISGLAVGDVDGDGRPDTAVTSGDGAWILLGQGDGSLGPAVSYSTGEGTVPNQLATADFNSDAKLDVVTANTGTQDVSVLPGNGDGTFRAPGRFATGAAAGSTPKFVAVADFNGDGNLDVTAAGSVTASSGFVSVLPGGGDGSFQAAVTTSVGDVDFMTVGDVNRDNKPDLITVSQTDGVSILRGVGDGTFAPAASVYPGNASAHAAVEDLNGDGNLDLAVADSGTAGGVTVLLGNGDGTFALLVNPGGAPRVVTIGDFNGDGKADLAAASDLGEGLLLLVGKGDGTFAQGVSYDTGGATPRAMSTGDFDGDGTLDIAVGNVRSRDVLIVLNRGDGTFRVAPSHQVGIVPNSVAEGDFDGNGVPDLVVTNRESFDLSVLVGNGDGTFKPAVSYPLIFSPAAVAVGDFNADGRPDLAVTGSFKTGDYDYGSYETGIGLANGDANTIVILPGNGDGTFAQPGTRLDSTGKPDQIVAQDLNGDGKLDLVNLNRHDDNVSVFLGNGDGTFQSAAFAGTGDSPRSLAVADFNSDGKPDIAVANTFQPFSISLLFGNGDGTFQDHVVLPDDRSLTSLHAADFNGDGKQDLAGIHIAFDDVSIYLGNGDGTFEPRVAYTMGSDAWVTFDDSELGDFNADGNLDIAVSDNNSAQVRILEGAGDGTFRLSPIKAGGLPPNSGAMAVADYNVDGRADVAVISPIFNEIGFFVDAGFVSVLLNSTERSSTEVGIEDDDQRIDYSDGWHTVAHSNASDGHFGMNNSQSPQHHAKLVFDVYGDSGSIAYHYATSPQGGSADIYLDGVRMSSINYRGTQGTLRSPAFGPSVTFDGLGRGTHTLELRAINGSVYLDRFTLLGASPSAQPASGPGQTRAWQGTLGIGERLLNPLDVGTGTSNISLVAESSNGIPIQLVLMDPSGLILSVARSSNGVAVINHPITRTGLYQLKVVNVGLGAASVWTAATPFKRRLAESEG